MATPISRPKRMRVRNSETQSRRKPIATTKAVKNRARPVKAKVVENTRAGSAPVAFKAWRKRSRMWIGEVHTCADGDAGKHGRSDAKRDLGKTHDGVVDSTAKATVAVQSNPAKTERNISRLTTGHSRSRNRRYGDGSTAIMRIQ